MPYVTTAELNTFLWTSWEDALVASIGSTSEAMLNSLLSVNTLDETVYTEQVRYKGVWPYYLENINPTVVSSIWGISLSASDYRMDWRRLVLSPDVNLTAPSVFPYLLDIVYTAWFARDPDVLPEEIKYAVKIIAKELYVKKDSAWITEFREKDLTVKYSQDTKSLFASNTEGYSILGSIVWKYKKNDIYSTKFLF